MQENLVIVESPAKAQTIEKFLGKGYKVLSSYGHIRDLKSKDLSIDLSTFSPQYVIPSEKKKVVSSLREAAQAAKTVWLASDEDREGEAISWHLAEVLGLDPVTTKRIVFHEITKSAILSAIDHPRGIDMNLVDAQQARRLLDRLVGFKLSPVLWKKVKPSLSAGRVQSVAVRLIVDREREIQQFEPEAYYRVTALFSVKVDESVQTIPAELDHRFATDDESEAFLSHCRSAAFTVENVTMKPLRRQPAPPFTTSTLQQEASRKLGMSVSHTMSVAQHLYESGLITYMRTDSVNLSSLCIGACKKEVTTLYGEEYSHPRNFTTRTRGAQEAHEAIRPTYMDRPSIDGTAAEKRLYDLIWKRTLASQMSEAQMEKTTITISVGGTAHSFVATGEMITFDGFLKVYRESVDDDSDTTTETSSILPPVAVGDRLWREEIIATQRYTQGPTRYTEASLVKKMEELGIGRPSTYAPTISTIQQREYVVRGDKPGVERSIVTLALRDLKVCRRTKTETIGRERGKLLPTDVGIVVNDFLIDHFPEIMDYNFTATVEEQFDKIAEGELQWNAMLRDFWTQLSPVLDEVLQERKEHKVGERALGSDPTTGKTVFVKIGRYGPMLQLGEASDTEKPRFAQMPRGKTMDEITIEEALDAFRLPRTIGEHDGDAVVIGVGRYGPYIYNNGKYTSLPRDTDPLTVTLDEAVAVLAAAVEEEKHKHLRSFDEDSEMEILNGRYGPYIAYKGKNYRLPKKYHTAIATVSYDDCLAIVSAADERGAATPRRRKR